jgi:Tol biopolymer transport system component
MLRYSLRPTPQARHQALRFITVLAICPLAGCGTGGDILEPPPAVGAIVVTTRTAGVDLDADGYTLSVDDGASRVVASNERLVVADLAAGDHQVALDGIAANCRMDGENPRVTAVAVADTTEVAFGLSCSALTGTVIVTASTTGSLPDPDGYLVSADGGTGQSLAPEGQATFSGLAPGSHTFALSDLAPNCTVSGDNPVRIEVTRGTSTSVAFSVSCSGPAPTPGVGQVLFTSDRSGEAHIYRLEVAGGAVADLTPRVQAQEGRWSPDGSKILFTTNRNGNAEIYVMGADGSAPVRLTTTPENEASPVWSPDGSRIAFTANREIRVMNADGSGRVTLGAGGAPAWSPDGALIAFVRTNSANCFVGVFCPIDVYAMAVDGSQVRNLTNSIEVSHRANSPAWSPDGSRIAYWRTTGGFFTPSTTGVAVMTRDGGSQRLLVSSKGIGSAPVWSPDGSRIAFAGGPIEGTTDVRVVPATGGLSSTLEASPAADIPTSWR